jgi:hypothetical protein
MALTIKKAPTQKRANRNNPRNPIHQGLQQRLFLPKESDLDDLFPEVS